MEVLPLALAVGAVVYGAYFPTLFPSIPVRKRRLAFYTT